MKDILIINSLIKSEQEVITSYEKYKANMLGQQISSMVEDSIVRHNNHVEALKKLSEEVR